MKNVSRRARVSSSVLERLALILLCSFSSTVLAEGAGVVTHLSGTLTARATEGASRLLSVKSEVKEGETLSTLDNTYARIKFSDGGEVVLRPNSQFAVSSYAYKNGEPQSDNFAVGLLKGGMRMVTGLLGKRNPEKVSVTTTTATIGIRGTHFGLLMCQGDCINIPTISGRPPQDGLHIDVADGSIQASNPAGTQLIGAGQFGFVQTSLTPPVVVPPNQGIQVTMPPSISQNTATGRTVGQTREASECAVQ